MEIDTMHYDMCQKSFQRDLYIEIIYVFNIPLCQIYSYITTCDCLFYTSHITKVDSIHCCSQFDVHNCVRHIVMILFEIPVINQNFSDLMIHIWLAYSDLFGLEYSQLWKHLVKFYRYWNMLNISMWLASSTAAQKNTRCFRHALTNNISD